MIVDQWSTIGHGVKQSTKWDHRSNEQIAQSMGVTRPLTVLKILEKDELGGNKAYKSWEQQVFNDW